VAEVEENDGTIEDFSPECTIALNYDDQTVIVLIDRKFFCKSWRF
jgi:hypothetical protein